MWSTPAAFLAAAVSLGCFTLPASAQTPGRVLDPSGRPVAGARVRIQGFDSYKLTGADGTFELEIVSAAKVAAALPGYRIGSIVVAPQDSFLEVKLPPLPEADNPKYVWEPPSTCAQCHAILHSDWSASPHAMAASDPIVLALYRGTRFDGSPSPGFGYRKAHPDSYGDCAFCHAPAFAAKSSDPSNDLEPHHDLDRALTEGTPAERSGVMCDFCHKVKAAIAGDQPPRLGEKLTLLRPPQFEPLMFGPFDDVTFVGMGAAYSPLHGEGSDLCALCHWDRNRHGVEVGSTFREWRESPYAAAGTLCQDCHMTPDGENQFCLWEPVIRNPDRIYSHTFRGTDPAHLQRALSLELSASRVDGPVGGVEGPVGGEVKVDIQVKNIGAGHHVPTGTGLRQAILVVEARRPSGEGLPLQAGPTLPAWAGQGGPPSSGFLAGLPGRAYARITTDGTHERVFDSEATGFAADTRLAALASDSSSYRFALDGYRGAVEVRARVVFRRWWKDLGLERGFPESDTVMIERAVELPGEASPFIRGDADRSGGLDLADGVLTLGYLFLGDPSSLACLDAVDTDDSGILDLTDAIRTLSYLFIGGSPPAAPFPAPGLDLTSDTFLDC